MLGRLLETFGVTADSSKTNSKLNSVEDEASTPRTTKGDFSNEKTELVSFGNGGGHTVRALTRVSPDIMLVHQSKMAAFNRMMNGEKPDLRPISREVKDLFLKQSPDY